MTKRGRKPDTKIIYTPEQTRRYKSQWSRYEKGLELARSNLVHKIDDKTYRVESVRSPIGYWEIKLSSKELETEQVWFVDPLPGNSITVATSSEQSSENSISSNCSVQEQRIGITFQDTINLHLTKVGLIGITPSPNSVTYRFDWSTTFAIGGTIMQGEFDSRDQVSTYASATSNTSSEFYAEGDLSACSGAGTFGVIETAPAPLDPDLPTGTMGIRIENQSYLNLLTTNTGGGSGGISITQTVTILKIDGEDVGSGYECTCPDFSLEEDAFNPPSFPSMSQPRNWQGTQAGCPTWDDGERRCCHIVAVQDVRGEEIPVPQDIPTGEA
jgi:hypothetical protein